MLKYYPNGHQISQYVTQQVSELVGFEINKTLLTEEEPVKHHEKKQKN
jgi:hypothetical protein